MIQQFREILSRAEGKRLLVVGDAFLDEYVYGRVVGIAKEGPTPVLDEEDRQMLLGGAAYAAQIASSYGLDVTIVAAIGRDRDSEIMRQLLQKNGIATLGLVSHSAISTSLRTHLVAKGEHNPRQEIFRLRRRVPSVLDVGLQRDLFDAVRSHAEQADGILVIDQDGSTVSTDVLAWLGANRSKVAGPVVGDSQSRAAELSRFTAIVVNDEEAAAATGLPASSDEEAERAAQSLRQRTGATTVVLTRGARSTVAVSDGGAVQHLQVHPQSVYDLTGAGETVSTLLTVGLLGGADVFQAAQLASQAASLSVSLPGPAIVPPQQLLRHVDRLQAQMETDKIVEFERLREILARAKRQGRRVAWTNGCFDLLHVGHILYLEQAKKLGDLLVVGLNSDASVRVTKGPKRPIVQETQRAKLLASLSSVDYVIVFDEISPKHLIEALQPDVYVKGGDYTIDTINQEERRIVEGYGGQIAILPGAKGMSTSNLIQRILDVYNQDH